VGFNSGFKGLILNFQKRTLTKQTANLFGCEIAVWPQHLRHTVACYSQQPSGFSLRIYGEHNGPRRVHFRSSYFLPCQSSSQ